MTKGLLRKLRDHALAPETDVEDADDVTIEHISDVRTSDIPLKDKTRILRKLMKSYKEKNK